MNIAIQDVGDDLLAVARMDGSMRGGRSIAMLKISNAARPGTSTDQLGKLGFEQRSVNRPRWRSFRGGDVRQRLKGGESWRP
jgi:uncharacterized protein GlcG (DUF336 family)